MQKSGPTKEKLMYSEMFTGKNDCVYLAKGDTAMASFCAHVRGLCCVGQLMFL